MKKTNSKIGILLLTFGIVVGAICLVLPSATNNRVAFGETKFGLIPAGILILLGLNFTILSTVFAARAKKIAAEYQAKLQPETIILFEAGVGGSLTFRNFHRPGNYAGWRKVSIVALVALTKKRLLALQGSNLVIDVPLTDERLRRMKFSVEEETTLLVAFDANLFQPEWSGEIEYRFKTARANEFLQKINEAQNKI